VLSPFCWCYYQRQVRKILRCWRKELSKQDKITNKSKATGAAGKCLVGQQPNEPGGALEMKGALGEVLKGLLPTNLDSSMSRSNHVIWIDIIYVNRSCNKFWDLIKGRAIQLVWIGFSMPCLGLEDLHSIELLKVNDRKGISSHDFGLLLV